ncbi:hypothetical protein RB195_013266 [Necator americanus]|uniref:EGF-like domain-containing protein n=1 Tax=Necator americanus TaxID=51031 RepID=A0ABR1DV54_NECAM
MRIVALITCFLFPIVRTDESPFHRTVKTNCDLSSLENDSFSSVYPVDNDTVVILKGTNSILKDCEVQYAPQNELQQPTVGSGQNDLKFGAVTQDIVPEELIIDSENCEELCAPHGRCSLREAGTPIEHYECLCDYGYRGMHCEEKIRTKFALMYFVWICVLVEFALIMIAIKRYANRKFFESPLPAQRFVDIMISRCKKKQEDLKKNN